MYQKLQVSIAITEIKYIKKSLQNKVSERPTKEFPLKKSHVGRQWFATAKYSIKTKTREMKQFEENYERLHAEFIYESLDIVWNVVRYYSTCLLWIITLICAINVDKCFYIETSLNLLFTHIQNFETSKHIRFFKQLKRSYFPFRRIKTN